MAARAAACAGISSISIGGLSQTVHLAGSQQCLEKVNRGQARVVCKKEGIHPQFFKDAKVYCNGELVMTTGGTQAEYVVDVWSGNHPFYQGNKSILITEAGQVDRFNKKWGNLGAMSQIPILTKGEVKIEKKKGAGKKGGKR